MQLGHDDLRRGNTFFLMDTHRDTPPVIPYRNGTVGVDCDGDGVGVTGQSLVNSVVYDLIDHMMQAGAIVGVADVHPGPFANSL